MKNRLFSILALIAIMLTTACTDTTNFIYGDVVDRHSGEAIEGCQVMLMASNGTLLSVQKTGADGRWGFEVETGEYSVAFAKSGYAEIQEDGIFIEIGDTRVNLIARLGEGSSEIEIKWTEKSATSFADGNGTEKKPFIIKTGSHLDLIREENDGLYFKLANDIDLRNKNWKPIENFSGTLDGNGYAIYNLRVENDEIESRGLIGTLNGTVKNLAINGVKINGKEAGTIVGYLDSGTINNCSVVLTDGSMIYGNYAGGIAGKVNGKSYIENCRVEATNSSAAITGNYVGGIAGGVNYSPSTEINNCKVNCNIAGESYVGGIAGSCDFKITNSEYKGYICGIDYVGGIAGYLSGGTIVASKAVATIEGEDYIGGIIGKGHYNNKIVACYCQGEITAASSARYIGGLSGENYTSANLCYTTIVCNHSKFTYPEKSNNCYSVYDTENIAEKMEEAYSDYADYWNFDNVWIWKGTINGEEKQVICPRLAWEN